MCQKTPMHLDLAHASRPPVSSKLAIPPSPFSPRLPLTPPATPPERSASLSTTTSHLRNLRLPAPPQEPLSWLWQCHVCNRCYKLGVTRRCLDDGHYFCSGTTTVKRSRKNNKKTVRHQACASEFDYQAWKSWGQWRRNIVQQIEAAEVLEKLIEGGGLPLWRAHSDTRSIKARVQKSCWDNCDYPSECRWGKQYGVQTPPAVKESAVLASWPLPETEQIENVTPMELDEVDLGEPATLVTPPEKEKKPSMDDLLESVKRRKRRSVGLTASPLASNPPSPAGDEGSSSTAQALQKAFDDFELDFRKSFVERAGAFVSSVVSKRHTTTLDGDDGEKGQAPSRLRVGRKKSAASIN